MKRVSKVLPLTLAMVLVAMLLVGATGCTCKKPIEEVPPPPPPPPPPKVCAIDAIDANPWTINVGQTSSLSVRGTPNSGPVTTLLTCIEGTALGTTKTLTLTEATPGVYSGTATADATLPPCKYRVEAEMACPGGSPVKLVSSRALTVVAPPPAPTACQQFMEELQRDAKNPKILFNFDKSIISSASAEYIKYVAGKLASFKGDIDMVLIEGHTDPFGTTEYNLGLGADRARATLDATQAAAALDGVNFETKSWGEEQLLVVVPSTVKTQKAIDENQPNRRATYTLQCRGK